MRTLVFLSLVVCALIIGSVSWTTTAAMRGQKQRAVAKFDSPVTLQGAVLKGTYLFVHDDAAMKRGEACTRVYKGESEATDKLVASFHCIAVPRATAKYFKVRTLETSSGTVELREFQFGGESEGHAVPMPANTAVVMVAN